MSTTAVNKDLVVLTADKDMKFAFQGLLTRPEALKIRAVSVELYSHPEHDPGCLLRADDFLRPFHNRFSHALVTFDREGCGRQKKNAQDLEDQVERKLKTSGWADRASAIVIDPELENWVFSDSQEVDNALGWGGRKPNLRKWLKSEGFLKTTQVKPTRPKEAMQAALRKVKMPRSSSIYGKLAEGVDFKNCTDRAFNKLVSVLQSWFSFPDRGGQ